MRQILPGSRARRSRAEVYEGLAAELPPVEPTADQLAAITKTWPFIEAEIELLDVQTASMDIQQLDDVLAGRLRRAQRTLLALRLTKQIERLGRRRPAPPRLRQAV